MFRLHPSIPQTPPLYIGRNPYSELELGGGLSLNPNKGILYELYDQWAAVRYQYLDDKRENVRRLQHVEKVQ